MIDSNESPNIIEEAEKLNIAGKLIKPVKTNELFNVLSNYANNDFSNNIETEVIEEHKHKFAKKDPIILVVEDTEIIMFLIKTFIQKLLPDAIIIEAIDGVEGVDKYKKVSPDIILLDIQLPNKDGYSVAAEIRAHENQLNIEPKKIIALTARAVAGEKERCLKAGMDDFIAKPIDENDIANALKRHLAAIKCKKSAKKKEEKENQENLQSFNKKDFMARIGEDENQYKELIDMAKTQVQSYIENLKSSINQNVPEDIRKNAHKLKGVALFLCFEKISELAQKIEFGYSKENKELISICKKIEVEFSDILKLL
ncbi:MAG: response regulator [Bacteroidetes bacterium]|nr:response regulator [Bacteroidota bacterium]